MEKEKRAKKKAKTVGVDCKDLYQMLIGECRYGYTRNNHLMPAGAFDHCRTYLPLMLKADEEYAKHTAKQLAEEAIDQLLMEALRDDEKRFSFFQEGIPNMERELKAEWTKGVCRFSVSCTFSAAPGIRFLSEDGTVYLETHAAEGGKVELRFLDFDADPHTFHTIAYKADPERPGWYNSVIRWQEPILVDEGEPMAFTVDRNENSIDCREYSDFIDFCLDFVGSAAFSPYNFGEYVAYLSVHPKN